MALAGDAIAVDSRKWKQVATACDEGELRRIGSSTET
jgi:hypothetical protein